MKHSLVNDTRSYHVRNCESFSSLGPEREATQLCEQKEFNIKNCELGKSQQGNQKDRKATEEHHRGRNCRAQGQKENG